MLGSWPFAETAFRPQRYPTDQQFAPMRLTRAGLLSLLADGGLPLFELSNPNWRSSSAIRTFRVVSLDRCAANSAISSSLDGSPWRFAIVRFLNRKLRFQPGKLYRKFDPRSSNQAVTFLQIIFVAKLNLQCFTSRLIRPIVFLYRLRLPLLLQTRLHQRSGNLLHLLHQVSGCSRR